MGPADYPAAVTPEELHQRYFVEIAAAFVRGSCAGAPDDDEAAVAWALEQGIRIHRFKRTMELPRVRRVLGVLRQVAPATLVDVGSGRGAFLWPLLQGFGALQVTAVDLLEHRVEGIRAVSEGGVDRLVPLLADAGSLPLPDASADVVTLLEVLEHLPDPRPAAVEAVRVARRMVIATVPSHPDDNPEHLHLFDRGALTDLLSLPGVARVRIEQLRGHLLATATIER